MLRRGGYSDVLALSLVIICVVCGCGSESSAASLSSQTEQSSPRPRGPLFVVDSRGKRVGQFFPGEVFLEINGQWWELSAGGDGFVPPNNEFDYQTQDCSGTPYVPSGPAPVGLPSFVSGALGVANNVIYYTDASSEQLITCPPTVFRSLAYINPDGTHACETITAPTDTCSDYGIVSFAPVLTLDISFLRLVPPFHLQQGDQ
jgi:hypothetical protein